MDETYDPRFTHVHFYTDSMGRKLQKALYDTYIETLNDENSNITLPLNLQFHVHVVGGEKIQFTFKRLEDEAIEGGKHEYYVLSGINNVSKKYGRKSLFLPKTPEEFIDLIKEPLIKAMESYLKKKKVIPYICTITSLNTEKACIDPTEKMQEIANEGIWGTNGVINTINKDNKVPTPWLSRFTHTYTHGRRHNHYMLLEEDGVHPTDYLVYKWAKELLKHVGSRLKPTDQDFKKYKVTIAKNDTSKSEGDI